MELKKKTKTGNHTHIYKNQNAHTLWTPVIRNTLASHTDPHSQHDLWYLWLIYYKNISVLYMVLPLFIRMTMEWCYVMALFTRQRDSRLNCRSTSQKISRLWNAIFSESLVTRFFNFPLIISPKHFAVKFLQAKDTFYFVKNVFCSPVMFSHLDPQTHISRQHFSVVSAPEREAKTYSFFFSLPDQ